MQQALACMNVFVVTTLGTEGRRDMRLPVVMVSLFGSSESRTSSLAAPRVSNLGSSNSSWICSKARRRKGFLLTAPANGEASMPRFGRLPGCVIGGGAPCVAAVTAPSSHRGLALLLWLPRDALCNEEWPWRVMAFYKRA